MDKYTSAFEWFSFYSDWYQPATGRGRAQTYWLAANKGISLFNFSESSGHTWQYWGPQLQAMMPTCSARWVVGERQLTSPPLSTRRH